MGNSPNCTRCECLSCRYRLADSACMHNIMANAMSKLLLCFCSSRILSPTLNMYVRAFPPTRSHFFRLHQLRQKSGPSRVTTWDIALMCEDSAF